MKLNGFALVWSIFAMVSFDGWSQDIDSLVRVFYNALNKGDSLEIADYFHSEARIKHIGEVRVWDLSLHEFLEVAPKFKSDYYSEEITQLEINTFQSGLTYADVHFDFYVEGSYSHSGVDHICYSNRKGKFKIESVYSSDFKGDTKKEVKLVNLNLLMDQWHLAAAEAKYDPFFDFMANDFIYLGTDPSERWTKDSFASFCKPYFDKGKSLEF